jgi:hypothetical protein
MDPQDHPKCPDPTPATPTAPQEPVPEKAANKAGTSPQDAVGKIDAVLVATNGTMMARTKVRTHPMPQVVDVYGWPFTLRLDDFLLTGKAIYSGYYPKRGDDDV